MYGYGGSGEAVKAVVVFVGLLLVVAVVAGIYLGGSELLSPSVRAAEAEKLRAEADALRAQTAYEERQRQMALDIAERKAEAELQAYQARRATQLELMKPLAIAATVVGSIAVFVLTLPISYYFITRARAVGQGQSSAEEQPIHPEATPSPSKQKHGGATEAGRYTSAVAEANVNPDDMTYDGFLAHFYDCILHPKRARIYYTSGIAPEIEDVYLAILTEAQIIAWESNGHSGWILPRQIRGVEDVRRRVSRQAFYSLASACLTLEMVEPQFLGGIEPQQMPIPAFSNS